MTAEALTATIAVPASVDAVFAVLADPVSHSPIDGTGWVCGPLNREPLTRPGQVFRMAMYHPDHPDHPDGRYEVANQVRVFDPPTAISWRPGTEDAEGRLSFGGWVWRYDLARTVDGGAEVRLTYDWSGATAQAREVIGFPPFGPEYLDDSLRHLAVLATG
ncbi:MAG: ATPase [Phycicoccus sp.]